MDFRFDEKQEMLKKTARGFFEKECPKSLVREAEAGELGYSKGLWSKMAELGWLGLGIPVEYGGSGGDFVDLVALYEEIGRGLVPGPHFVSAIVCAQIILGCGSETQKRALLPRIARGESVVTLAMYEFDTGDTASAIELRATRIKQGYLLEGTKLFVPYANLCDHLVCVGRTRVGGGEGGITLFLVDAKSPGISLAPLLTLAGDKQSEVTFAQVRVSNGDILGPLHGGWLPLRQSLQKANVLQCAEMVGAAQKALEMAVDYAKQRVQFGRPIGAFQAIQHKCAEMVTNLEAARYLTYEAACSVRDGDTLTPQVAMAKVLASTACRRVTKEAHQIFAGAGLMAEHDLNFYYRRVKGIELNLGGVNHQVKEVAQQLDFL